MGDVLARRKVLATARARLIDRPDAELPGVPDHVTASWRRSLANGVAPDTVSTGFTADLDTDSRLVRCARPVIEQLVDQTAGAPVCVALTDERARLLVRVETATSIGRAADGNQFALGFGYDEAAVGTNGVGTVLEAGGSVHVVGAEHFVEALQPYACAGAPVRDPFTGRIEGVLDLSCRVEHSSPVLHSLVRSAAGRIQDALLRDRDAGQQALFDLYTRVEARTRRAVLAVGARTVLVNAALSTLLDPGDLAALQEHARFRTDPGRRGGAGHDVGEVHDVDDRLDLPSGARVRMRGGAATAGGTVVGLVAVVTVLREADGMAVPDGITEAGPAHAGAAASADGSPAWRAARAAAEQALRAGTPLLVLGEPGSGRRWLLRDLERAAHGEGRVVEIGPEPADDAAGRIRAAGPSPLVVLADLDHWDGHAPDELSAALAAADARLAATVTDPGHCGDGLSGTLARFRRSVTVPPLRHRSGDLPSLVTALLADLAPGRDARLSAEALRTLARHRWPGNVAELRDALALALRRRPVGVLDVGDLPESCQSAPRGALRPVDRAERDAIVAALRHTGGNRAAAASVLGLARSTLYRKIAHYGITG